MAKGIKRILGVVTVNWGLKLLALSVALLSFLAIRGAIGFEVYYDAPVEVSVDSGIAILDQSPRTVQVMFRGSREDLRRIEQKRIKAVIKANANSPDGSELARIRLTDIQHGSSARVVVVRPDVVRLTFDRESEKMVAVARPTVIGSPLIGRVELDYNPTVVRIRGPKRRLAETVIVGTEPVDVSNAIESFSKRVRVLSPGEAWVAQIEPREVNVDVRIVVRSGTREFADLPVAALVAPGVLSRVSVEPERVNVRLSGSAEILESLKPTSVLVTVDCAALTETTATELPVHVRLLSGAEVAAVAEPGRVTVRFEVISPAASGTNAPVADDGADMVAPLPEAMQNE